MSEAADLLAKLRAEAQTNSGGTPQPSPLSWSEVFASAARNTPRSAVQFAEDTITPFLEPGETLDSLTSLGKGLIQLAIPGEQADEKTAKAVGQFYANRYGSIEKFKRAFAEDPVGIIGDVSVLLTGGGAAAARAPGVVGKVGRAVQDVGQAIDPTNVATKTASVTGKAVTQAVPDILGMTTGAGSESVRQAYQAGREGGVRQERFTDSMRGTEDATAVVDDAMKRMREMRSTMKSEFGGAKSALELEKVPVDMGAVFGDFKSLVKDFTYEGVSELSPRGQAKLRSIGNIIARWQKSPGLHTAKGLDILKRRIDAEYPDGINPGDSAMIVAKSRDMVMDQIRTQVPEYVDVMKPYEEAIKLEREMQKALSLNNTASADTALRKLQSVVRNNVNANFGARLNLVEQLDSAGDYYLLPRIAGQALNPTVPRGIQAAVGAGNIGYGVSTNPASLATLPMMSPRAVGETAMKAGEVARAADPVTSALAVPLNAAQQALGPHAGKIQAGLMGSRAAGQTARADDDQLTREQLELLRQRYR